MEHGKEEMSRKTEINVVFKAPQHKHLIARRVPPHIFEQTAQDADTHQVIVVSSWEKHGKCFRFKEKLIYINLCKSQEKKMYLFIGQADVLQDAIEVELLNRKFPETIMNSL